MFLSWQGKKSFVKCAWTEFIMDLSLGSVFRKHSNNFCLRSWRSSIFAGRALTSVHMPHTHAMFFLRSHESASLTLWNLFERCILHPQSLLKFNSRHCCRLTQIPGLHMKGFTAPRFCPSVQDLWEPFRLPKKPYSCTWTINVLFLLLRQAS